MSMSTIRDTMAMWATRLLVHDTAISHTLEVFPFPHAAAPWPLPALSHREINIAVAK
jgi:hypothetical protein